jgi:hypothetical protein
LEVFAWARSGAHRLNEVLGVEYPQGPRGAQEQNMEARFMNETHSQKKWAPMFSEPAFGAQTDF